MIYVVMDSYTTNQRLMIVKVHYEFGECFVETVRKRRENFGRDNPPNTSSVRRLISNFEESGSVLDIKRPVGPGQVATLKILRLYVIA